MSSADRPMMTDVLAVRSTWANSLNSSDSVFADATCTQPGSLSSCSSQRASTALSWSTRPARPRAASQVALMPPTDRM
jgi:hypothetical protein